MSMSLNIRSIGPINRFPIENYNNVIINQFYIIEYNERDYIGKCIDIDTTSIGFSIFYSKERNNNKWERENIYNFRLNQSSNKSVIHKLIPLQSNQAKRSNKQKVQNSINVNNNKVNLLKFKEMLTCKICFERTVNKVLNCGHTFCRLCIDGFPTNFECPFCKKEINKNSNVKNLYFS
jgi:hypothetical protein